MYYTPLWRSLVIMDFRYNRLSSPSPRVHYKETWLQCTFPHFALLPFKNSVNLIKIFQLRHMSNFWSDFANSRCFSALGMATRVWPGAQPLGLQDPGCRNVSTHSFHGLNIHRGFAFHQRVKKASSCKSFRTVVPKLWVATPSWVARPFFMGHDIKYSQQCIFPIKKVYLRNIKLYNI